MESRSSSISDPKAKMLLLDLWRERNDSDDLFVRLQATILADLSLNDTTSQSQASASHEIEIPRKKNKSSFSSSKL